ncbi:helix-turn-helix domain-containing protein [Patescibacteria group bacterium]|nr:helix-turn-helix domain-containing protein [Patescibacteria group bacterium]
MSKVIRLAVSEAAKIFGVNERTIRRAIANHELHYVVVQGRYKINFDSLLKWSQQDAKIRNKTNRDGIGQFVSDWKISNTLYSPNPGRVEKEEEGEEK